jgi:hypothetical protein
LQAICGLVGGPIACEQAPTSSDSRTCPATQQPDGAFSRFHPLMKSISGSKNSACWRNEPLAHLSLPAAGSNEPRKEFSAPSLAVCAGPQKAGEGRVVRWVHAWRGALRSSGSAMDPNFGTALSHPRAVTHRDDSPRKLDIAREPEVKSGRACSAQRLQG